MKPITFKLTHHSVFKNLKEAIPFMPLSKLRLMHRTLEDAACSTLERPKALKPGFINELYSEGGKLFISLDQEAFDAGYLEYCLSHLSHKEMKELDGMLFSAMMTGHKVDKPAAPAQKLFEALESEDLLSMITSLLPDLGMDELKHLKMEVVNRLFAEEESTRATRNALPKSIKFGVEIREGEAHLIPKYEGRIRDLLKWLGDGLSASQVKVLDRNLVAAAVSSKSQPRETKAPIRGEDQKHQPLAAAA